MDQIIHPKSCLSTFARALPRKNSHGLPFPKSRPRCLCTSQSAMLLVPMLVLVTHTAKARDQSSSSTHETMRVSSNGLAAQRDRGLMGAKTAAVKSPGCCPALDPGIRSHSHGNKAMAVSPGMERWLAEKPSEEHWTWHSAQAKHGQ